PGMMQKEKPGFLAIPNCCPMQPRTGLNCAARKLFAATPAAAVATPAAAITAATAVAPAAGARRIRSRAGIVRRPRSAAKPAEQGAVVARRNAAGVAAAVGIGPAPVANPVHAHHQPKE